MERMPLRGLVLPSLLAALLLSACGGGGGGGGGGGSNPPPSGNITISGTVTFDRPSYTGNTLNFNTLERLPVRGATLEVLRASDQSILATTTTDATTGSYSATVSNVPFIVRVKAQLRKSGSGSYDFEVRNNTSGNALYTLDSSTVTASNSSPRVNLNAATGWGGTAYTGARAAAPFAILHMLWEARLLLHAAEPNLAMPALEVYWSPLNSYAECNDGQPDPTTGAIGTTFFLGSTILASDSCAETPPGIYVLGDANGTADDDPDEFDSSVIAHELGHYFQEAFSRDESMGGPHYLDARHDLTLAFSEGWGNAFQGFVLNSRLYRDTVGASGSIGFAFDMENNSSPYSVENGFFAEASVHEFLWDVYDGAGESGDQISLGYGPIHTVMRQDMISTPAFSSVFVMGSGLESRNPAQQAALRSRLVAEGINGTGAFADGQTLPGATSLLPVYVPMTLGVQTPVISTNRFADVGDSFYQSYNRLGSHRYLRISLPAGGGLTVRVQGPIGSDPDFALYREGVDQCGFDVAAPCFGLDDSVATGLEEATFTGLSPGTYVLDVAECSYLGELCRPENPDLGTDTLLEVTVTQP